MSNTHVRLLLLVLTTACTPTPAPSQPGGGDGGRADASMRIDYATYVTRSIALGCQTAFDCCDDADLSSLGVPYPDAETCVREASAAAAPSIDAVVGLIADGGLIFDAALAAECLATSGTASCSERALEIGRIDGPCIDVVRGTTPLGGDCETAPCADGICDDGVCVPYPALGEACWTFRCAGDAVCIAGTCDLPHAAGGACERDLDCQRGLFCRGTCVPVDRCVGG